MDLKVVYHYHSGFSVQCDDILLVFDYWRGENHNVGENGSITLSYLSQFRHVYVFVSHAHPDHYDPIVETWRQSLENITYIIAADMPPRAIGVRMAAGEGRSFDDTLTVTAYPSTDLGVSFLVRIADRCIFHAGDLNLWHWREESTLREIENAEKAFYSAVSQLEGIPMDVAMFPVDPRQGLMYDAGANHFILSLKPQIFIPMHWQDRIDILKEFSRRAGTPQTEILAMALPGMTAAIHFEENCADIRMIDPPKEIPSQQAQPAEESVPKKDERDPFSDSDMPVHFE